MKKKITIPNKNIYKPKKRIHVKEGKNELKMTAMSEGSQLRKLIHFFQSGLPSVSSRDCLSRSFRCYNAFPVVCIVLRIPSFPRSIRDLGSRSAPCA